MVEVCSLNSTDFEHRAAGLRRPGLVLVPNLIGEAPGRGFDLALPSELKERIRTVLMSRIDPAVAGRIPRNLLRVEIAKLVNEIATEERIQLNNLEEMALAADISDDMVGLGPLEPFLDDDEITDILVNGPFDIYVERHGRLEKTTARFRDTEHLANVAQRIARGVGRRIDEASPMVDARLANGSRANIVLPPLVINGGTISIRKFPMCSLTLEAMVRQENLSHEVARVLQIAALSRVNILISGGTGSGKTTLLNAVSHYIEPDERVITIEDAVELRLQQPHVVQMETRPPNIEGVGQVGQRELVRNALRMRPDRIIVGEVRGPEAFDMLQAMNTGHDGSMSTVHANSPRDALYRVENMVMMANLNLPLKAVRMHVASALNLVVHIERMRDGIRRVQSILEIAGIESDVVSATGGRIGLLHLIVTGIGSAATICLLAVGTGLSATLVVTLCGAAIMVAPALLVRFLQGRYQRRFLETFPDALDVIVRAVRAGLPIPEAVEVVTREIGLPVGGEFRRLLDELRIGTAMEEALQRAADRVRVPDFRFFVVSPLLQSQTGGGIAETLSNLSAIIRQRKALRLKARALTAEAQTSAIIVAVMPLVAGAGLFLINRELMLILLTDPRGRFLLGLAGASLVLGIITMKLLIAKNLR
jgi:pilus assembly protein CpaF